MVCRDDEIFYRGAIELGDLVEQGGDDLGRHLIGAHADQ
jgi:hypothetical protein